MLSACLAACAPAGEDEHASVSEALTGQWQTGAAIGNGVAMMDTGNVLGENVFIGYAGYNINLGQAQSWVQTLYDARLRELGVKTLYAVQGPADSLYNGLEIGNSKIAAALGQQVNGNTGFVLIAGHSSGSFVADELLQQLDTGADPSNAIGSRTVYFDLDGDQRYVGPNAINRLRRAYYVNARNPLTGSSSYNHGAMASLGAAYAGKGGSFEYDARSSGCTGTFCTHISLINTVPHDPGTGSGVDYADFNGRPVNHWWVDVKSAEAGLGQCATPFATQGAIEFVYALLGGCGSVLGPPTGNEGGAQDGVGRFNHFAFGSIFSSPATSIHEIHGAIHGHYAAMGFERSALGYPTSNELTCADGNGKYGRFEHGAIYFTFFTGAHAVTGAFYDAWAAANFENGALGYPISDVHDFAGVQQVDFEHGVIVLRADGSAQVVLPVPVIPVDAGTVVEPPALEAIDVTLHAQWRPPAVTGTPLTRPEEATGGCSASGGGTALIGLVLLRRLRLSKRG
jgi:hypothetical protein